MTVVLLSRGLAAENLPARDTFGLRHVALETERQLDVRYGVIGTPSAILIGADGRVAGPLVTGADQIGELAELELRSPRPASTPAAKRRRGSSVLDVRPPAAHAAGSTRRDRAPLRDRHGDRSGGPRRRDGGSRCPGCGRGGQPAGRGQPDRRRAR